MNLRTSIVGGLVLAGSMTLGLCSQALGDDPGWIPIADSETDFSDVQGQGGWFYLSAATTGATGELTPMANYSAVPGCGCGNTGPIWHFAPDVCFCGQQFCFIGQSLAHGDSQGEPHVPVRRFVVPHSGRYRLDLGFSHGGGCGGINPMRLEIRHAGNVLWAANANQDGSLQSGSVEVIAHEGDAIEMWSIILATECGGVHQSTMKVFEADCDGNGIVDSTDIATYQLLDIGGNGIPDCCELGTDCSLKGEILVVDPAGLGDFLTIQAAYDAADDGMTVLVLPGVYSNPTDNVLDAPGKAVRVVARDGPAATTMDAQGQCCVLIVGNHPAQVIEGFTIANAVGGACNISGSIIRNCVFRDNEGYAGGATFSAIYSQPRFEYCRFENNTGTRGGALYAHQQGAVLTFVHCEFIENTANEGGAIHIRDGAKAILEQCTFRDNTAGVAGAAFIWFASSEVRDCLFEDNRGEGGIGAIHCGAADSIERTTFRGNYGGDAGACGGHVGTFTDCLFDSNTAGNSGGALVAWCFPPTLVRCTFTNNSARGGGAVWVGGCETGMTATDCLFLGNRAVTTDSSPGADSSIGAGGAIRMDGTHLNATRCQFIDNEATWIGGGTNRWYGSASFTECVWRGNRAGSQGGGDFSLGGAQPGTLVTDSEACDNFPDDFGAWHELSGDCFVADHCETGVRYATQWLKGAGATGHVYGALTLPVGTCFAEAQAGATAVGGTLASLASAEEATFAFDAVGSHLSLWTRSGGANVGPYLGAQRTDDSWSWLDGTPWKYSNFSADPAASIETALTFWTSISPTEGSVASTWGTVAECPTALRPNSALVEWSADCNDDGEVDYAQILAGALTDYDSDGIPDVCDPAPCFGDIIEDGRVDAIDLAVLLSVWGTSGGDYLAADINQDGTVGAQDLSFVLASWGSCP